ncbi:outer membrane lipoprotein LolB [Parvibium lacunae]|nr:outer membrane lipoprotein LolB [Parvibium lacunae]
MSTACIALIVMLSLVGCTTFTTVATPTTDASVLPPSADSPVTLAYSGRFSLRYEQHGSPTYGQGRFTLTQQRDSYSLELNSPFGNTLATLSWQAGQATLWQPNQPLLHGTDPNDLINQLLGWPVPVNLLPDWLQALVNGKISSIQQQGWEVTTLPLASAAADQPDKPRQLQAEHPGNATQPAVRLRILLDANNPPVTTTH